jgi:ribulose-5-phosphate 4-epimerase/fuculose-1-phosphate aldolase
VQNNVFKVAKGDTMPDSHIGDMDRYDDTMGELTISHTNRGRQLPLRTPPTFNSVEEERLHRRQRVAGALRIFARYDYDEGAAGHVTARDPQYPDHFWVNPVGMPYAHIRASDLVLVNHAGQVVEGDYPINLAAFEIHSAVHKARPDVVAACHAHSLYGRTWASLGRLLDPITQDACAFWEDHTLMPGFEGPVFNAEEAARIAQHLGKMKAIILQNHGLLTVGQSVDEAAWWFITMEHAAQSQLIAEAAGTPQLIRPEVAKAAREQIGTHVAGWFQFQPLWDVIVRQQPDLL